ncbi:hypothetical protein [Albidovulum sp.]|uniref:hypothetical protein n=1 Tax=Albidovulum sp. TaxID=1872424 RepID=UPI0039B83428
MTRFPAAAALLWIIAAPVSAAPATAEGAAGIEAALRAYLGQTPGVLTVMPEGDSYSVTLDPAPWIALAEGKAAAEISPLHISLADHGDGTWAVTADEPISVRINRPGPLSLDLTVAAFRMDCRFDTALMACRNATTTARGLALTQIMSGPDGTITDVTYRVARIEAEATAVAALSGGGVDTSMRYTATDVAEAIRVTPAAGGEGMPMDLDIAMASYDVTAEASGMQAAGLHALLAWAVAHPSEAAVNADPEGLKVAIRGALPLWSALSGTGEAKAISVATPFGSGSAESMTFGIDMSGIVADGRFRESLAVKGLKLPTEIMPAWVPPLLPSEASIDVAVSGFDLAAPAALFIDALAPGFQPDEAFDARMLAALLPEGKVTVTLAPQGVVTPSYTLDYEGGIDAGPGRMPEGRMTVAATGIDAALDALSSAPEDVRSGAVPGVMMLRGLAKPAGVGRFVWDIEMTPDGKVTVNGMDMSALAAMQ